jgi:hypothetical protein
MDRAYSDVAAALFADSMSLLQAQYLASFLNFCAQGVTLGRTQLLPLFTFMKSFPLAGKRSLRRRIRAELAADLR